MTRAELLAKLRELAKSTDTEAAHASADRAILAYINDPAVTRAYNQIEKWYA